MKAFLQVMTAGVGASVLLAARFLTRRVCIACGATGFAHAHRERGRSGIYCPNCGINFTRGAWDVERLAVLGAPVAMDVPFPNRTLVTATSKPAVLMTDFRL